MLTQELTRDTLETWLPAGYAARPATLGDIVDAVALFNAYSRELIGKDEFTIEKYRLEWEVPGLNMETDIRVVLSPHGQVVGCMEFWDLTEPHARYNTWGRIHPAHTGLGIGTYLLTWVEERARNSVAKAPDGARVAMVNWTTDLDQRVKPLFEKCGWQLIRHGFRMEIELNAPPPEAIWPAGITVRTFVPGQDERATLIADRESFRDHWGFVERPLEDDLKLFMHFMREPDFDPTLWLLAMDGNQIAGISLNAAQADDDPEVGWVSSLGVLRSYRRKGLGLALLRHSFAEFYRRGKRKVGLGVDASSLTGATRLYERAGMHVARQSSTFEKELRPGYELSTQSVE
jgi:mycothiol synthase